MGVVKFYFTLKSKAHQQKGDEKKNAQVMPSKAILYSNWLSLNIMRE